MAHAERTRYYVAAESGGFGVDPSTDGSGYLPAQIERAPYPENGLALLPTKYATGRDRDTADVPGPDGSALSFSMPLTGLSAAAGDGAAPPTADALDLMFANLFGSGTDVSGEGIAVGGTTSSLVLDTDSLNVEDLALVNYSDHSEWRNVSVDAGSGTYTVAPVLTTAPDDTKVAYGSRRYSRADGYEGGNYLSMVADLDGSIYRLAGGRLASLKLRGEAGKMAMFDASMRFDSKTLDAAKTALPAISKFTNPAVFFSLSSVYFGSTLFHTKSVEIDWGITLLELMSTAGANGRSGFIITAANPKITLQPAYATGWETDFAAGTERTLLIQLGLGKFASSRVSTAAFYAASAQVKKVTTQNDGGYLRQTIELGVTDAGIRTGSTAYRYWTLARG